MKINNDVEAIGSADELAGKLRPMYIIDNYLGSQEEYLKMVDNVYDILKGCIEIKECREYPVKFKFYISDKKSYELQLRHFLINLFLWYPFTLLSEHHILGEEYIFDAYHNLPEVHEYINDVIKLMLDCNVPEKEMNLAVSEVLWYLRSISLNFSQIMNLTVSTETFIEAYNKYERLREIFMYNFSDDEQPAVIEEKMSELLAEETELFMSIPNNAVGIFLRSGEGIKAKQLQEFTSNGGMKPDINGNTVPKVINGNQLVRGLETPSNMYLDATGARKSYVMNKKVMGKAGYYAKSLNIIGTTVAMSETVKDCETHHYLKIFIADKKFLKKYSGRYYSLNPNNFENIKCIDAKKDIDLIGKTIYLRSPITCACRPVHGRRVFCQKCFGSNARLNLDIANGIGIYLMEEITKKINQNVLSAKHLLTTRSEKIEFTNRFFDIFTFSGGDILLRENCKVDIEEYELYIPEDIIRHEDIYDTDNDCNSYINEPFFLRRKDGGDEAEITTKSPKDIYISKYLCNLIKENEGHVDLVQLIDEPWLMRIDISNNELTKPLYDLMDLTSKKGIPENADEMAQKYTRLLIEADIPTAAIAGEIVVTALMRSIDSDYEYPNFRRNGDVQYRLVPLRTALERNSSINIGLIYQDLKRQLLSPDLYNRKGESVHDALFNEKTDTSSLREFYDKNKK